MCTDTEKLNEISVDLGEAIERLTRYGNPILYKLGLQEKAFMEGHNGNALPEVGELRSDLDDLSFLLNHTYVLAKLYEAEIRKQTIEKTS